jgi:hypothetical protein
MIYLVEFDQQERIAFTDQLHAISYLESIGYVPDDSPAVQECYACFGRDILHYKSSYDAWKVRILPIKLIGDSL